MMDPMTSVPVVRPASNEDEAALQRIDREAWDSASLFPSVSARLAVSPFFSPEQPPEAHLVAELDGRVVGYVRLAPPTPLPESQHVLTINGIAVDPAARGHGVGRALLSAAEEHAGELGATKLSLRVLGTNTVARAMYEGAGFQVEGVLRGEFRIDGVDVDDIMMALRVVPAPGAQATAH